MGKKYVYMSFMNWLDGTTAELYNNKIKPNLVNDKIKLLHEGPVYGVIEDSIMIHKTDLDIAEYTTWRAEACTVDGKSWIKHARTLVSTPF